MTEEDFLKRWSRRKREVAKAEAEPRADVEPEAAADALKPEGAVPEFDIESLPPLESINALTDVTAFLRADVPADLARAALRRVWTADPAIRDFVGLSENAWDFTDPNAMPGFGPLESTDEIRRMIANLVSQIGDAAKAGEAATSRSEKDPSHSNEMENGLDTTSADDGDERVVKAAHVSQDNKVLPQSNRVDIASQHDLEEGQSEAVQVSRRTHGRALPR